MVLHGQTTVRLVNLVVQVQVQAQVQVHHEWGIELALTPGYISEYYLYAITSASHALR